MRLLSTSTLQFHEFHGESIPEYAILSHTWGDEEVTLQDMGSLRESDLQVFAGYQKIVSCCALARSDGWDFVWIDTCCIDKTSSADLSEAINSMYQWYQDAEVCYAYLVDVASTRQSAEYDAEFCRSRWFKRGWTLQELLAPANVVFYNREWKEIGTKLSLQRQISSASGINRRGLYYPMESSVAARMSWAASRATTRVEDIAYCLIGLFDVNMPLLYGEGSKAFIRLQEMILQKTDDESIFAWVDPDMDESGMFAPSPSAFLDSSIVKPLANSLLYRRPSVITNRGLEIDMHINVCVRSRVLVGRNLLGPSQDIEKQKAGDEVNPLILLNCVRGYLESHPLFIPLLRKTERVYVRRRLSYIPACTIETAAQKSPFETRTVYITADYVHSIPKYTRYETLLIPPEPAFSFAKGTIDGSTPWDNCHLYMHDHFRGWFYLLAGCKLFMLHNGHEELFVLQVNALNIKDELTTFKIYVPKGHDEIKSLKCQTMNVEVLQGIFRNTEYTDRMIGEILQAGTEISISVRRIFLKGRVFNLMEISCNPTRSDPASSCSIEEVLD